MKQPAGHALLVGNTSAASRLRAAGPVQTSSPVPIPLLEALLEDLDRYRPTSHLQPRRMELDERAPMDSRHAEGSRLLGGRLRSELRSIPAFMGSSEDWEDCDIEEATKDVSHVVMTQADGRLERMHARRQQQMDERRAAWNARRGKLQADYSAEWTKQVRERMLPTSIPVNSSSSGPVRGTYGQQRTGQSASSGHQI
mmetsp:Transcript_62137/g.115287  ORF Transcript_62137/g.115287 Transcript_62137/m.115287 type:complete len:198 (-) Transcript_62137:47-640(-)